jgi:hypothetical protein
MVLEIYKRTVFQFKEIVYLKRKMRGQNQWYLGAIFLTKPEIFDMSFRDKIKKSSQDHGWRGFNFQ